jgi:hypothetical protein
VHERWPDEQRQAEAEHDRSRKPVAHPQAEAVRRSAPQHREGAKDGRAYRRAMFDEGHFVSVRPQQPARAKTMKIIDPDGREVHFESKADRH